MAAARPRYSTEHTAGRGKIRTYVADRGLEGVVSHQDPCAPPARYERRPTHAPTIDTPLFPKVNNNPPHPSHDTTPCGRHLRCAPPFPLRQHHPAPRSPRCHPRRRRPRPLPVTPRWPGPAIACSPPPASARSRSAGPITALPPPSDAPRDPAAPLSAPAEHLADSSRAFTRGGEGLTSGFGAFHGASKGLTKPLEALPLGCTRFKGLPEALASCREALDAAREGLAAVGEAFARAWKLRAPQRGYAPRGSASVPLPGVALGASGTLGSFVPFFPLRWARPRRIR